MDMKVKAYSMLALSLVIGALLPVLLVVTKGVDLYEFFFFAYAIATVASLSVLAARGRLGKLIEMIKDKKKLAIMCLMGVLCFLPIGFGMAYAEQFVSASFANVIFRTSPLLMLLLLPPLLRERLSKYQIAALMLAFAGLYIGVIGGNPSGMQNSNTLIILFLVVMALAYALAVVLIKKYVFDLDIVIAVSSTTMFVVFLLAFLATGFTIHAMTLPQVLVLIYVGTVSTIFSFYMYFYALRVMKVTLVANIFFLSPFITFLFAYLILGEAIEPYYIAIALLTGVGIVIQSFDTVGGRYLERNKQGNIKHMAIFDVTGIFAGSGELGINTAIMNGGRVLAVKLNNEHSTHVSAMAMENTEGLYTDSDESIKEEAKFVKDVLGAGEGEFVVMKAGATEESEKFFEDLYSRIKS